MSRLIWDQDGDRRYETGVSNGVLFVKGEGRTYLPGVAWNGLTGVTESPSGAEPSAIYADNIKYLSLTSVEEFGATIEAYTYPDEFAACDGSEQIARGVFIGQQNRKKFGFAYKTIIGNDVESNEHGYKLHIVYGAEATPSEKAYATVNESPEAITFSWTVTTTPVEVAGHKPSATMTVDSTKISADKLKEIEDILFGTELSESRILLPDELVEIMNRPVVAPEPDNNHVNEETV